MIRQQTAAIRAERERLISELRNIAELQVWPSEANFVLVRTPEGRAREIFEALKQSNILVKCLDGSHPQLRDCLRLTVGEPGDSDQLLRAQDRLTVALSRCET